MILNKWKPTFDEYFLLLSMGQDPDYLITYLSKKKNIYEPALRRRVLEEYWERKLTDIIPPHWRKAKGARK